MLNYVLGGTGREQQKAPAFVVGSGPNGLTAAIVLAKAGFQTTVFEAQETIGGGTRSAELTLPGFLHDICSAVHPMAVSSPVLASLSLEQHGLEWIQPPIPVAHPFDDGSAAVLYRSIEETCARLGPDGPAYKKNIAPLSQHWPALLNEILRPPLHLPARPILLARFGALAIRSALSAATSLFDTTAARALFAGLSAHSVLPLESPGSASFGWVLGAAAHGVGWPIPRGGSQQIANALASYLGDLGGKIITGTRIASLAELTGSALVLCDVTPRQFLEIARDRMPARFKRQLRRYRYGPAAFKVDWALSAPIPWKASECAQAGTVHLGGTIEEIAASERAAWNGELSERPFVILAQPSLFDPSRAPEGRHTAWAYCHVPNGSQGNMLDAIERQIERFAPGFRSVILARNVLTPAELERHNANLVGGDITGGAQNLKQLVFRPTRMLYRTPLKGVYLCSSSTPPGGGVHGMCGFNAARVALQDIGRPNPL